MGAGDGAEVLRAPDPDEGGEVAQVPRVGSAGKASEVSFVGSAEPTGAGSDKIKGIIGGNRATGSVE